MDQALDQLAFPAVTFNLPLRIPETFSPRKKSDTTLFSTTTFLPKVQYNSTNSMS